MVARLRGRSILNGGVVFSKRDWHSWASSGDWQLVDQTCGLFTCWFLALAF